MAGEGDGKIFFLPRKKKPPDERKTADEKATPAIAASMITVSIRKTFQVDNVHIALNRTKYAAAAAANKVAAAGWNMRIGTVACMPMDNNLNTIDAAVAAANIVAFALRTPLPPPPMRSPSQAGMCEFALSTPLPPPPMRPPSQAGRCESTPPAAAATETMAANAPTNPTSSSGIQGLAPSFYPRLGLCRRRVNIGGRSGDEWGPRWKLAVGGVPWRRAAATANTADSRVRQLPTRRRRTDDQGELAPHACDRGVRRPLATAENTTDAAAAAAAAAIKTMAANAPTNPQTLPGIQGLAPSFTASSVYPRLGMCCRRVTIGSRSGDEWGPRWELAVGGVWEAVGG